MKNVKTKLLVTLGLTTLLSTGLYAYGSKGECSMMNKMDGKTNHKYMKSHKKSNSMMSMFYKLNLSDEQKDKIVAIKKELSKNRVSADVAFTKNSFDKEKFIEVMKQKRENMLESKAEMIDRVYKILTPQQKEQLKVLMDLKKEKKEAFMNKRMNFDKNCNGRG